MSGYKKVLSVLIVVASFLLVLKGIRDYNNLKETFSLIVIEESKSLTDIILSIRKSFETFLVEDLKKAQDKKIMPISIVENITTNFSSIDNGRRKIEIVSMLPHETRNKPTKQDEKILEWFKNNPTKENYFEKNDSSYIYYAPLRVDSICLECHTKSELTKEHKEGSIYGAIKIIGSNEIVKANLKKQYDQYMIIYTFIVTILFMLLILLIKQIFYKEERYRKSLEKEIKSQAKLLDYRLYHDSLTALPNRNQLIKDLSKPEKLLLTLVNIDEFRHINDLYGEDSGDEVLISLAGFLKEFAKKYKALAYKLHADEFALIFKDISTKELSIIASELTSEVSQLVVITDDNFVINMGVTIGAAMDESELLTHADMALKQAKKNKLSYLLYEESLEIKEEYERNIEWARKIKKAIKNEKIVPYYQAIFNTDGKSIASVEVLMRMIDENAEAISPILFLDIAKKNKLYPQLTKIIIQKSFKELALVDIDFSINLSIIDIVNQKTFKFILDQIDKFPDPRRITFEILESEGVENYEEILNFVKIVKSYGCNIAIDDFGSGYSNFAHILNLKIDLLKLDASLIKDIDSNKSALVTIKAIDSFAKTLGIKTCAEFIHSKEVYETLKELKIDFMQGYYFAEPIPLKELKKSFPLV